MRKWGGMQKKAQCKLYLANFCYHLPLFLLSFPKIIAYRNTLSKAQLYFNFFNAFSILSGSFPCSNVGNKRKREMLREPNSS